MTLSRTGTKILSITCQGRTSLRLRSTSTIHRFTRCFYSIPSTATRPGPLGISSSSSSYLPLRIDSRTANANNNRSRNPPLQEQRRTMFIQTDTTPNPESLKFLPGRPVLAQKTPSESNDGENSTESNSNVGIYATATDKEEIARSPLLKALFAVEGIKSIYLGADFITVTKFATSKWAHIRVLTFSAIMDFYASGQPVLLETPIVTDTTILDTDDEVVAMIKELLETRIRPAVQEDGGDIRYVGFEEESGLVKVQLAGSCVGCPSSSVTLKNGVENMLMHYVPEVTGVEAIEEEDEEDGGDGGEEVSVEKTKAKTYEERLAAAGIPFSD